MTTVNRKELLAALRRATRLLPRTTHIHAIRNIQLATDEDSITLRSTNLEEALVEILPATGPGERCTVCIPVHQLVSVIIALPQYLQEVTLEAQHKHLLVATTKIPAGCVLADFPTIPRPPQEVQATVQLPEEFAHHFRFVRAAASQGDVRVALRGVFFDFKNGNIAASDGKRLHCAEIWQPTRVDGLILSPSAFDIALPTHILIPKPSKKDTQHAFLLTENGYIATRPIEGKFPNYLSLLPKEHGTLVQVDRAEILSAIEQAMPAVSERLPACQIHLNEHFEIRADNKETGASYINEVSAAIEGNELKVMLNAQHFLAAIRSMGTQGVTLSFRGAEQAIYLVSDDNAQWALLMPLTPEPRKTAAQEGA